MAIKPKKYERPVKGDPDAIRIKPRDLVGNLLLVNVKEVVEGIKTQYAKDGTDAVSLDVASVETGSVALDQLWFNDALVDGLRDWVGEVIPCRIEWIASQSSGYSYMAIAPSEDEDDPAIEQFLEANPNLFDAPTDEDGAAPAPSPVTKSKKEPAGKPRW